MSIGEIKSTLMDEKTAERAINRMAYEIAERNKGVFDMVIIGIQTKGVRLAHQIARRIKEIEGVDIPVGSLDITFYRDDLTRLNEHPVVMGSDITFAIEGKKIILVDDVLFSGRTIRAAIEELFDLGRPDRIELAVLIDRGNRELPISPDYTGRFVPTSKNEYINVEIINDNRIGKVTIHNKEA